MRDYFLNIYVNGNVNVEDYSKIKNLEFKTKNGCKSKLENCVYCCCCNACGGKKKLKIKNVFDE